MKRILTMFALIAFALGMVVVAEAGGPGEERGMGQGHPHHCAKMAKALKPTPEQASQWSEMREQFRAEMLPLHNQLFSKRMELVAILANPEADSEAIKEKHKEVIDLQAQIREKVMDHQLAFRQTLNPEQLAAWIAWKTARPCHCRGMGPGRGGCRGKGMHPGMGPGMAMDPGIGMGPGMAPDMEVD